MLIKNKYYLLRMVMVLVVGVCAFYLVSRIIEKVTAQESKETQVTVSNEPPAFSVMQENPASTAAAPTNADANVTFEGTASDDNEDDWFLIVCKNDSTPTHNGTSAPECNGGSSNRWCRDDTAATSGSSNSCQYTVQQTDGGGQAADNSEIENWYAFACDAVTSGSCSAANSGTGSDGSESPFYVNHKPTFDGITEPSGDPGASLTFTATYTEYDDAGGSNDTVNLYVCETAGATSAGCTGTTLCSQTGITSPATLECSYDLPSVIQDGAYDFYSYMYDGHDLASTPATISATQYTANNVAPTVGSVTITDNSSGSGVNLHEGDDAHTAFTVEATITDNNNCHDVYNGGTVVVSLYRSTSGGTFSSCDASDEYDRDNCYPLMTCVYDQTVGAGGDCTGTKTDKTNTDATAGYKCTIDDNQSNGGIFYHADPTDSGTTWTDDEWYATMLATDDDSLTGDTESTTPTEINSLTALDLSVGTLDYGSYQEGQGDSTLEDTIVVSGTGNVVLDTNLKGDNMACDDVTTPSCTGDSIAVGQQEYSLVPSTNYGSGTDLTVSDVEAELNCAKTTFTYPSTTTIGQATIYWGIAIPAGKLAGIYEGTNYVTAVKGETPW